jgi:hypothetical protein
MNLVVALLFAGQAANTLAADVPTLGLAELTSKLKLTDQQQKQTMCDLCDLYDLYDL